MKLRSLALLMFLVRSSSDLCHGGICKDNDTYCGDWNIEQRLWQPLDCSYRDVTSEQANKCLANRTLGLIGDSQMRDLGLGLASLLYGMTLEDAEDQRLNADEIRNFADPIVEFDSWSYLENKYEYYPPYTWKSKYLYPSESLRQIHDDITWQIQSWELYHYIYIEEVGVDVLTNAMVNITAKSGSFVKENRLRPMELVLWNIGLHNQPMFNTTPYGENYYNVFVKQWLKVRNLPNATPSVYVSMNEECKELLNVKAPPFQHIMIHEANHYIHNRLRHEGLPYFDASSIYRSPQRCEASGDGLHGKQWSDMTQAKILLNYLCDDDWNWVGGVDRFV